MSKAVVRVGRGSPRETPFRTNNVFQHSVLIATCLCSSFLREVLTVCCQLLGHMRGVALVIARVSSVQSLNNDKEGQVHIKKEEQWLLLEPLKGTAYLS